MVVSPPSRPQEAALARGSCGVTCAGVKGGTPEVDAIEDSRRRGTDVVERDATELYIAVAARVVVAEFTQVAIRWTQAADIICRETKKMGYAQRFTAHA